MINLLPPDQKQEVFNEKKERIVINLMFFLVIFVLFFTTTTYFIQRVGLEKFEEERRVFAEERSQFGDVGQKIEDIEKLNKKLANIEEIKNNQPNFSQLFFDINSSLTETARLDSFNCAESGDDYHVTLSGYVPDWEGLLELERELKKNFESVNFSSDSWTQTKDISFLVKLERKNEN